MNKMHSKKFIQLIYDTAPALPAEEIIALVDFVHNGKEGWNESDDANADFREEVVDMLFENYSEKEIEAIRYLLKAEIEYAREETMMRETLRQLTFMLYCLGKPADVALLFEAKKDTCFDAGIGLDIELIFGRDKEAAIAHFTDHPHPEYDLVQAIHDHEDYEVRTPEEFIAGILRYYGK